MSALQSSSPDVHDISGTPTTSLPLDAEPAATQPYTGPVAISSVIRRATPPRTPAGTRRNGWEHRYRRRLRATDTLIVLLTCAAATVLSPFVSGSGAVAASPWIAVSIAAAASVAWIAALEMFNTRASSVFGTGAAEYARVLQATAMAFGLLTMAFVLFEWRGLRPQLLLALPIGLVTLILARWGWRRWLVRRREFGQYASRTVVVGDRDDVEYVLRKLGAGGRLGYLVVGTAVIDEDCDELTVGGVRYPVISDVAEVAETAARLHATTVIVASQPSGDAAFVKRLAWELEGTAAELVLSSRITDVAGPRMSLRPVEGLPLIHVQIPRFEGGAYAFKRAFDIVFSAVALALFAPFAALLAIAIKIDSRGPVFFRQTRIGRDGREFRMVKFRSMKTNAEAELAALMRRNEGSGPLFKMQDDPRVTRLGRILRRYSLDELPQFWNVLVGDMSIVGPRPPLMSEVTSYDGTVFRRLYIKPGITGPWQVGGRSDLSWEESVRLDLRYVENWSVLDDIIIMWRTVKVMVRPEGAY